jgi:hypothetical protein
MTFFLAVALFWHGKKSGYSGFPVKKDSPQRPSAAERQRKKKKKFNHRGAEFAEFGAFL